MATKVLVVGRHAPDLGESDIEIVGQENVLFPTDVEGTETALVQLADKARELGAQAVLLQNTPGIVSAALLSMQAKVGGQLPFMFGVIISVPGPRAAGVVKSEEFPSEPDTTWGSGLGAGAAQLAADFVQHANSRAKVEVDGATLTVTVDPVPAFVFERVIWL